MNSQLCDDESQNKAMNVWGIKYFENSFGSGIEFLLNALREKRQRQQQRK